MDLPKGTQEVTCCRELELRVSCGAHGAAVPSAGCEPASQPQVTRQERRAPRQLPCSPAGWPRVETSPARRAGRTARGQGPLQPGEAAGGCGCSRATQENVACGV